MTCKSIRSSGLKDQTDCDQCQVRFVIRCIILCFLFLTFYKIRSFIARVQDVSKFFVMFFNIHTGFIHFVKYIMYFMVFLCSYFSYLFFSINRLQDVLEFLLLKGCFKLAIIIRLFNVLKILCLKLIQI